MGSEQVTLKLVAKCGAGCNNFGDQIRLNTILNKLTFLQSLIAASLVQVQGYTR